ncbi:MAG: Holliday junction branch migration protein RuvA, partial [Candidatus Gastranaerophilales bacterium]|nr:Holliday junction branch migration protein RuvA [Candidatus Gastranaerophilales bacterium]
LKGHLISKQINSYRGSHIVIDVNNTGYFILTGKSTIERLKDNEEVKIYVSLTHKEDSMSLTGFITKEERDIFNILQSVSGIGVKLALLILDEFSITELIDIMIREDSKELSRAKGVGTKVAQKIIIELKDKLINWSNVTPVDISDIQIKEVEKESIIEVQSVLISLGYSANEAKSAIKEVLSSKKECNKTEDILKYSLEFLSRIT